VVGAVVVLVDVDVLVLVDVDVLVELLLVVVEVGGTVVVLVVVEVLVDVLVEVDVELVDVDVLVDVLVEVDVLVDVLLLLVVVVVGQHIASWPYMLVISSSIVFILLVIFVTFSVISFTPIIVSHITVSNLARIVFKPSHVSTSVQGSGVPSYVTALVPIIVVLFI